LNFIRLPSDEQQPKQATANPQRQRDLPLQVEMRLEWGQEIRRSFSYLSAMTEPTT
jgi:hypothetical protein